jgi:zinc protease
MKSYKFLKYALILCFVGYVSYNVLSSKEKQLVNISFDVHTLDNGLKIFFLPVQKSADKILHMMCYDVGAKDETVGKQGMAHLLEHVMFNDAGEVKYEQIKKMNYLTGNHNNAFTAFDYSVYFNNVHQDNIESIIKYEASRMRDLVFDESFLEKEKKIILEEYYYRYDSNYLSKFDLFVRQEILAEGHPYARLVIGEIEDIKSITLADTKQFYKNYYRPDNSFVIISGNYNKVEIIKLAKKYYGSIKTTKKKQIKRAKKLTRDNIQKPNNSAIISYDKSTSLIRYRKYFILPNIVEDKRLSHLPMFLNYFISAKKSFLYQKLVEEEGLLLSINVSSNHYARYDNVLYFDFIFDDLDKLPRIKEELNKNISLFMKGGFSADDFNNIKQEYLYNIFYKFESYYSQSFTLMMMYNVMKTKEEFDEYFYSFKKTSKNDIRKFANYFFKNYRAYEAILIPETLKKQFIKNHDTK